MGWFGGGGRGEEEVCWEVWRLEITLATPRTESGMLVISTAKAEDCSAALENTLTRSTEQKKVLRAMETTLHKTALKIVAIVNQQKEHIPPITTSETNPFPYQIILNPRWKDGDSR